MNKNILTKSIALSLAMIMVLELTACGTVFYPERKGAKSGSIDPVVAVADAIGLLFFFIPGVIAFAVDFNNGTIYTSHGRHASLTQDELKSVTIKGKVDKQALSVLVTKKLSLAINVDVNQLQVKRFASEDALLAYMNISGLTLAGL